MKLKMKGFWTGLMGLGLVLLASPAFGFQGTLTGSPMDNFLRTFAHYGTNDLVVYGSGAATAVGGLDHATSRGEGGHGWIYSGLVGLGIAASARDITSLLPVTGSL